MPDNDSWTEFAKNIICDLQNYSDGSLEGALFATGNGSFRIADGVNWADAYAANPNSAAYGYKGSDCTNFTSQIKHEGGVPYYLVGNMNSGWSHWIEPHGQGSVHSHSVKWVRADAFAKYFGVKSRYKTKDYDNKRTAFIKFAAAVKKGSFIAYDEEGDGDWNHNAFVSHTYHSGENSRRSISYKGSSYKDFKIAQHTRNYNKWVSSNGSGGNGWEDLPYSHSKVVFAIIN